MKIDIDIDEDECVHVNVRNFYTRIEVELHIKELQRAVDAMWPETKTKLPRVVHRKKRSTRAKK